MRVFFEYFGDMKENCVELWTDILYVLCIRGNGKRNCFDDLQEAYSDLRYNIIIQEADEVTPGNNVASALSVTLSMKHYDAAVGTHGTWLGGNRSRHYEAKYR